MTRRWTIVLAALALTLGVAGCANEQAPGAASSSSTAAAPAAPPEGSTEAGAAPSSSAPVGGVPAPTQPAASNEAWLAQVCTAITPAVQFQQPAPSIDLNDLNGTRDQVVAYLDQRAQTLQTAAQGVSGAGYPPVEGGQQAAVAAQNVIQERLGALQQAANQLRGTQITPAAIGTITSTVQTLGGQLTGAALQFQQLGVPQQLADTARTVPQCQAIGVR